MIADNVFLGEWICFTFQSFLALDPAFDLCQWTQPRLLWDCWLHDVQFDLATKCYLDFFEKWFSPDSEFYADNDAIPFNDRDFTKEFQSGVTLIQVGWIMEKTHLWWFNQDKRRKEVWLDTGCRLGPSSQVKRRSKKKGSWQVGDISLNMIWDKLNILYLIMQWEISD